MGVWNENGIGGTGDIRKPKTKNPAGLGRGLRERKVEDCGALTVWNTEIVYHRARTKANPTPKDRRGVRRYPARGDEKVRSRRVTGGERVERVIGGSVVQSLGIGANSGCSQSTGLSPPMFGLLALNRSGK